jgi:hypothetical protein
MFKQYLSQGGRAWSEFGVQRPAMRKALVFGLVLLTLFILLGGLAPTYAPEQTSNLKNMLTTGLGSWDDVLDHGSWKNGAREAEPKCLVGLIVFGTFRTVFHDEKAMQLCLTCIPEEETVGYYTVPLYDILWSSLFSPTWIYGLDFVEGEINDREQQKLHHGVYG